MSLERRDLNGEKPSLADDGKIRGLAIVFNEWTTIGSGPMRFRERVAPGAVTKTLREGDLVYLDNHDTAKPLARLSAGNLEIQVSERGVHYEADPPDTTYANDLRKNVRAGNILGNSFGFEPIKDKWEIGADGVDERTIHEMKLPEISSCTFPAYEQTEIGMRQAYAVGIEARDRFYERANKEPYGDVKYADPGYQKDGKKRYPLNTSDHIHAAWSYINQAKNAAKYSAEQLAHIKSAIKAAAKKIGMKISQQNSADLELDLRAYDPETGFMDETREDQDELETRDDEDGVEVAAMHEALARLADGDIDAARSALETALAGNEDDGDGEPECNAEGGGTVAHTTQGGAAVPLRELEKLYELVRNEFPATRATNEALAILEPLLSTPESEQRGEDPKPEPSTSEFAVGSEEGIRLQERFLNTQRVYRADF